MPLHNRVNNRELKEKIHAAPQNRITLSFYRYFKIADPQLLRNELYKIWTKLAVLGRIYVAHEGINAQVSVPSQHLEAFRETLHSLQELNKVRLNEAVEDNGKSFFKLKITVRNKIVADGIHDLTFDVTQSGRHLSAQEFNKLSDDPATVIIDMRNHYESEVGHFKNAICPDADTFREELPMAEKLLSGKKEQSIIMYCTGGIRCEKASAWMIHRGFKNVFQLSGGIIEYARQVKEQGLENKFIGKNFVFDERLGERISGDVISVCHQCGDRCDHHINCRNDGCHLLFIQCENCTKKYDGCCSTECMEVINLPARVQKEMRRGKAQGRMVFKKGRYPKTDSRLPVNGNP